MLKRASLYERWAVLRDNYFVLLTNTFSEQQLRCNGGITYLQKSVPGHTDTASSTSVNDTTTDHWDTATDARTLQRGHRITGTDAWVPQLDGWIHRSAGDTTPLKTLPDQTATDRRIVVAVSYTDLTLLVLIMNCFLSRTPRPHFHCNGYIRRTDPTLTYVHHFLFLFTPAEILKLLDTNRTLTHDPTLSYDKRTSIS